MKLPRSASLALWPLSMVYGGVTRLRVAMYRQGMLRSRRLDSVVISVGNLTVGGTGKTPMVVWLAERLAAEGYRPAILTRGYRGGKQSKTDAVDSADEVALLHKRLGERAEIGVGKNRYHAGRKLEQQGPRWFILDDGFQHLALRRDADIVLLDATDPFGGGWLLPAAGLREARTALRRADVVVITRAERAPAVETIVRRFTDAPVFYAQTELEGVANGGVDVNPQETDWGKSKFLAFCGIGNPAAFFYDLRRWGFFVAGERVFRDHHRYTASDIAKLDSAAEAAGADAMICTEKDMFNLRAAPKTRLPVYVCRIRLTLPDGEGFWKAVLSAVRRHHPKSTDSAGTSGK